jgi:hypothetical protein
VEEIPYLALGGGMRKEKQRKSENSRGKEEKQEKQERERMREDC